MDESSQDDFVVQTKSEHPDCRDSKEDIKLIPEIKVEVNENSYCTEAKLEVVDEMVVKDEDTDVVEPGSLETQANDASEQKMYKCNICSYTGAQARYLRQHMQRHSVDKRFICDTCRCAFGTNNDLKRHVETHSREKAYKCDQCEYATVSANYLKRHQDRHKGNEFNCGECDFSCKRKISLKLHLLCHSDEKPFRCKFCDYSSSRKETLKAHLRLHTGDKPFTCKDCGFTCVTSSGLCKHRKVHSDTVHHCTVCSYDTPFRLNLLQHMKTHSGEVKEICKCDLCPYYGNKAMLKSHMTAHATAKQYRCDKCDFSDKDINLLVVHMKTLHQ